MSKYKCEFCDFNTDKKTDHMRHINSKKHMKKVQEGTKYTYDIPKTYIETNKVHACKFCENIYSNSSALARHKKSCEIKTKMIETMETRETIISKDMTIKDIELNALKKEIENLHQELINRDKQVDTYATMLKSFTCSQTINYFTYISNNYPDTPALEGQKSYSNMIETKKLSLMDVIAMYYYDKKLVSFIGDYLVKSYKKEEPKNQSMWSTDVSRFTYIISQSCKLKGNIWAYDKKGSQTKKLIIEPALQYLRKELVKFCQENGGSSESYILKHMIAANGTIELIDNGELSNDIAKYIAPEFAITQTDNQALLTNK